MKVLAGTASWYLFPASLVPRSRPGEYPQLSTFNSQLPMLPLLFSLLTTLVLTSNLMAVKTVDIWCFTLPAAIILYPFAFVIGDLLTEFHGFRTTRRAVITAMLCNAAMVGLLALAVMMPPSQFFPGEMNDAFRAIFLAAPRIVGASFAAFLVSGVFNGWLFALIKRKTKHHLMTRSSVSTFFGVILDSVVFIALAFAGDMPTNVLLMAILGQIIDKLVVGLGVGVPLTYLIVKALKRR